MLQINYHQQDFKIKHINNKEYIFDVVRKRWVRLTEEEWVRQNFLNYLINSKNYPLRLIAVEKQIKLAELNKRFDIVVFRNSKPWMMVECKEPNVTLNHSVLHQVIEYNIALPIDIFIITNGNCSFAFERLHGNLKELDVLPDY